MLDLGCYFQLLTLYQMTKFSPNPFSDNKIKVAKMIIVIFERVENIMGKGENAVYLHFLLFPKCF